MLAIVLASLLLIGTANGLTIGVVVFPEVGHLNPLLAIVEEAAKSGHQAVIFGPEFFMKSCNMEVKSMSFARCEDLGFYNISMYDEKYMQALVEKPYFETLQEVTVHAVAYNSFLVEKMMKYVQRHPKELDILLVDFGALQGTAIADYLSIPAVMVWPLTLSFPLESNPNLPVLGSGFSTTMSVGTRLLNFLVQRVFIGATLFMTQPAYNKIRQEVAHVAAVDGFDVYYRRFVITPNIYGLDIAQPLCPNVVPVGFLARTASHSDLSSDVVPQEWRDWMEGCAASGIVYVNMGSVAVLPLGWMRRVESAVAKLVSASGKCAVWKLSKPQQSHLLQTTRALGERLRITGHIPFSPRYLLQHSSCRVFVTHCGDTSVYESVQNAVPMVGIPLFADQSDMCARVQDSGVGVALNKLTFTDDQIVAGVLMMDKNASAKLKLEKLARMGHILGGAKRAVEIVHLAAKLRNDSSLFFCKHVDLPLYQLYDLDILAILAAIVIAIAYAATCATRVCRRKKEKQD